MSSFQLNLSSLTLGAKERLACLDASGGFKALLSPPAGAPPAGLSGAAAGSPSASVAMGGLPLGGLRTSIESLVAQGGGAGHGEFSVAGGLSGGLPVFVATPALIVDMCCGAVAGGVKFCTLQSSECSFTTHNKKVEVVGGSLYVSTGRNSAFTHHHAPTSALSAEQVADLLKERHPKETWIRLLRGLDQAIVSSNAKGAAGLTHPVSILEVVTPAHRRKVRYEEEMLAGTLFATPGKRGGGRDSFDEEIVIIPSVDSSDQSPEEKMAMMMTQWNPVVLLVNKLGSQVQNLRSMVLEDLEDVDTKVMDLDARVGSPPARAGIDDCGTVWDGLSLLKSLITDLSGKVEKADRAEVVQLRNKVDQLAVELKLDTEAKLRRYVEDVQGVLDSVGEALEVLGSEQEKLTELVLQKPNRDPSTIPDMGHLSARLRLVEARLPSTSTRLGGEAFQSRVDVLAFVEGHVPSNCFYLFHDVVTLMESLTTSHVERKDVLQEWYQSSKVGVNEASACHMASFHLILPTVFGRTKEGTATSPKHHLPSVKLFREWNTFDGVSGVKGNIAAGMEDLKYQFRQDIDHSLSLDQHTKARLLATEMHECSQNFVMEMSSWMDAFFQELVATSEASEEEAWEVVGACIRKVFEVIRIPRVQAANATMDVDPKSQCATYLWALVQSHRVMKEFLETRFRNHGAIAPVIVLHIFKTRVTRVAHLSTIKRLEGKISALEKGRDKEKGK
jgi:hypothetical protein